MEEDEDKKEIEEKPEVKKDAQEVKTENKKGSFRPLIIGYLVIFLVLFLWSHVPFLQNGVHYVLDPTLGWFLRWNLTWGMMIIVFFIALLSMIAQKYGTDQKKLKELKSEQKKLQEEMKQYREHPQKFLELQKKQMEFMKESFKLSTRPLMFTGIPFFLLFRWFSDLFTAGSGFTLAADPKIFGMGWFWFYLVFTLVFSMVLRKVMKVV